MIAEITNSEAWAIVLSALGGLGTVTAIIVLVIVIDRLEKRVDALEAERDA